MGVAAVSGAKDGAANGFIKFICTSASLLAV